jgi:hypothetical protein
MEQAVFSAFTPACRQAGFRAGAKKLKNQIILKSVRVELMINQD